MTASPEPYHHQNDCLRNWEAEGGHEEHGAGLEGVGGREVGREEGQRYQHQGGEDRREDTRVLQGERVRGRGRGRGRVRGRGRGRGGGGGGGGREEER